MSPLATYNAMLMTLSGYSQQAGPGITLRASVLSLMIVILAVFAGCRGPAANQGAGDEGSAEPSRKAELKSPGELTPAGELFPAMDVAVLEPGNDFATMLNLGPLLGKKTVVFAYFVMGHSVSEQIVEEVSNFTKTEFGDEVAFFPVTRLGSRFGIPELARRSELLGFTRPVIIDDNRLIQDTVGAGTVPHITLIDSEGYVSFRGASSLKQMILSGVDVANSIRISAGGEQPPSVFKLAQHHPIKDLIGQRYKDFVLREYETGTPVKLSDKIEAGRLTAILYWSPRDRYSRSSMPGFVAAHRTFSGDLLNIISVLRDGTKEEVSAFAKERQILFPILSDPEKIFSSLYRAVSTPTLVIIKPDGIIDSVYTSGKVNFLPVFMTKLKKLIVEPREKG
jgi:peroxiredoxin